MLRLSEAPARVPDILFRCKIDKAYNFKWLQEIASAA